jgi:hypothetical protein
LSPGIPVEFAPALIRIEIRAGHGAGNPGGKRIAGSADQFS